jgi:hypothetical protein
MERKADESKRTGNKGTSLTLLSRRVFLSSVAATGTAVIWPITLLGSWTLPQKSATPPARAALPPPAGQEASYEWYLPQYTDPTIFTTIGLPADPAETAVSPNGELLFANDLEIQSTKYEDRHLPGTRYARNALIFALYDGARIVPIGMGKPARQSVEKGYFPIVITRWNYGHLEIRETAFSEPLKGTDYQSGLESTLAWASFEVTNHSQAASPLTLLAAQMGYEKVPKRDLTYSGGAVQEKGSALFSAQVPEGFAAEFHPVFPVGGQSKAEADPLGFLRSYAGVFNALAVRGKIGAGQTARIVFNRRFDFPGTNHWGPSVQAAVPPEELTERSPEEASKSARARWAALSSQVSRFITPDQDVNNIVNKAMLDGYFLTKRWNGQYIVFDSICYRCQWDDASTKWFYALDLMGDHATSERLLDTVFARQGKRKPAGTRTREGCFSDVTNTTRDGSDASWACCNGWALWAMTEHARLAHDPAWIEKHKPKILDGCEWIRRERQFSKEKSDNPCAGLLYGKFVCDMPDQGDVSGVGYFTYTDAISYMGLRGTGELLAEWGHPEGESLRKEAELYRGDIIAAIDRLTDKSQDPWYVPWMLHAPKYVERYFYDVCGPINLAYAGVLPREDERIGHVIRWIIDRTHKGSLEEATAGLKKAEEGGMFYSQDLAIVLLELGRVEDFLRIFYTLLASNISHETLTTCEWRSNTQPHVHSISSLVRMFRTMMVQERDGGLYLLQGTPRRWLEQGKTVKITEAPTWYGTLSLETMSNIKSGDVRVQLKVPERLGAVPAHLRLRLPGGRRIQKVQVDGREHPDFQGEWILLKGLTGKAEIVVQTA